MDYSDAIEIDASPEMVFSVLSDLPGMGRLSPENTGGKWLGSATGPREGAKFLGENQHEGQGDTWTTIATVKKFDPPSCFIFDITWKRFPISRWEFCVEPTPTGCRVIEKWEDRRNWLIRRHGDKEFSRADYTKKSIRTTLEQLKAYCESYVA